MPFKVLASLKKVAKLDAEIVAIAPLETARIVAAITKDPVKLAVQPYAGAGGKVTNVSLDEAKDVALVNKQVAVVKSGDDLWALLDIQHRVRVEQVGRDIRSLHACPDGDTALAIGWDGNGAGLVFQNNEVGGQQFVLRGDVRAASLGEGRTWVVVDGGPGGQLREHPGSTPERAAIARADLPAEAAGYDLLAGGNDLCAIGRRGASSVCVARRRGSGYEVKMIAVVGNVVDLAVIGTSLFVLGSDGKLRLYASDAIEKAAADEGPQLTFELDLRLNGEPTALCATLKGGNKLWAGSRGGDLVCCDAVKSGLDI